MSGPVTSPCLQLQWKRGHRCYGQGRQLSLLLCATGIVVIVAMGNGDRCHRYYGQLRSLLKDGLTAVSVAKGWEDSLHCKRAWRTVVIVARRCADSCRGYYRPGGQFSSLLGAVQTFVIVARGCADSRHGNYGLYEQSARDKSSLAVM